MRKKFTAKIMNKNIFFKHIPEEVGYAFVDRLNWLLMVVLLVMMVLLVVVVMVVLTMSMVILVVMMSMGMMVTLVR